MAHYTIDVMTVNWYCECCGSGAHWYVTLFEGPKNTRVWGTSRNDQFGGVLRDGDDTTVTFHNYEDLVEAIKLTLELLGHTVTLQKDLDDSDPYYYEADWDDEGENDDV
jgi:hypothetical protein